MQLQILAGSVLHGAILAARYHPRTMRVVLYSRPGCHLCDVARGVLMAERERTPFDLGEISIEGDDELELAYGIRIPVVEIDGREVFEIEVDRAELTRLLRAGAGS